MVILLALDANGFVSFTKNYSIIEKIDQLEIYSFLPIKKYFDDLSFGGCIRGLYGVAPAEKVHGSLLGLCDYIPEGIKLIFANSVMGLIFRGVVDIDQC